MVLIVDNAIKDIKNILEVFKNILGTFVIHPFAIAALPVILTLVEVKTQAYIDEVIPVLMLLEMFALVTFVFLWIILRDSKRAGVITSLTIVFAFCYLPIDASIGKFSKLLTGATTSPLMNLAVYFALLVLIAGPIAVKKNWRFRSKILTPDFSRLNMALNIVMITILILDSAEIIGFTAHMSTIENGLEKKLMANLAPGKLTANNKSPDIYYLLVDGFANQHTLIDLTGYDNSDFINFLKKKDFFVVKHAASNYDRTEPSLCSSLNMQYIDIVSQCLADELSATHIVEGQLIQRSATIKLLQGLGYKIINISSGSGATDFIPGATINLRYGCVNHFAMAVLLLTPLRALENYMPIMRDCLANNKLCPDTLLQKVVKIPGPKFVFIHTEIAHAPPIFDEMGNRLPLRSNIQTDWGTGPEYVAQLKFAQKHIEKWINIMLGTGCDLPVIIVQSDHGPGVAIADYQKRMNTRMRILNAYYFPGAKRSLLLYDSITPVNSFRVLFDDYFGANLKLLPDRVYWAPDYWNQFDVKEVSGKLSY